MDTERRGWWLGPSGVAVGGAWLLGGCMGAGILGQNARDFVFVDKNGDEAITAGEFENWGKEQGVLDAFMGEEKGTLGETALSEGLYDIWDVEGSGLTEGEWNEGLRVWFPDEGTQDFTTWDVDEDETLDNDEFVAGMAHTELLESWDDDGDGNIGTAETYERFYDVFDTDSDDTLTSREWTAGLAGWNWNF